MYKLVFTRQAQKDAKKIKKSHLKPRAQAILKVLRKNPFINEPPFKKLVGELLGVYSRRINLKHRIIYQVYEKEKVVKVIRMWTHYE